jgi:arylsulfatase A-like enzyme
MFEEAARVPLLLHLPGQTEARRVRGPVSQIDLVPTLLDLMDQSLPDGLQGKSLRQLLEGGSNPVDREDVFIEWNGPNNGFGADRLEQTEIPAWMAELASKDQLERAITDPVRTVITPDGWKFNCSPLGEHELYNLSTDPLETHNLASDREHQAVMQDLLERIRRWQEDTSDGVTLPLIPAR